MTSAGPIAADELAWGLECLGQGDTVGEIAEWSGRDAKEWGAALAAASRVRTPREMLHGRDALVASAYEACVSWELIGRLNNVSGVRARQLAARLVAVGALEPRPHAAGRRVEFAERRRAFLEEQGLTARGLDR